LNTPSGRPASCEQLGDAQRRRRVALGRLQDEAVAAGDGHRVHPHRHHGGEVERRDAGDHAERLAAPAVDGRADVLAVLALQQLRAPQAYSTTSMPRCDLAQRVVSTLPCSSVISAGDLVGVLVEQLLEAEHDLRALQRRRVGQAGKAALAAEVWTTARP
jgi:hypothetical protein